MRPLHERILWIKAILTKKSDRQICWNEQSIRMLAHKKLLPKKTKKLLPEFLSKLSPNYSGFNIKCVNMQHRLRDQVSSISEERNSGELRIWARLTSINVVKYFLVKSVTLIKSALNLSHSSFVLGCWSLLNFGRSSSTIWCSLFNCASAWP